MTQLRPEGGQRKARLSKADSPSTATAAPFRR